MRRRSFLQTGLFAGTGMLLARSVSDSHSAPTARPTADSPIKHSASKWCYSDYSVEELAKAGKEMGLHSIELLDPEDWPTVKEHDLTCAMANGPAMEICTV